MKFCEVITNQLVSSGYTHFFFVGGGNIMHLTGELAKKLTPVPVIHEVAAVIAAEYFNEISDSARALALVTAGPGLTNSVTGIAGAYLESRGVLIIGGQVKTEDLATSGIRQRGIQEIDGVSICEPITKVAVRFNEPIASVTLAKLFESPFVGRNGPVFLEIPLNVQASEAIESPLRDVNFEFDNRFGYFYALKNKYHQVDLICKFLQSKKIKSLNKKSLVELGCGQGINLSIIQKLNFKKIIGYDINKEHINFGKKFYKNKFNLYKADVCSKKFFSKKNLII